MYWAEFYLRFDLLLCSIIVIFASSTVNNKSNGFREKVAGPDVITV
jgi:hypothetical protein